MMNLKRYNTLLITIGKILPGLVTGMALLVSSCAEDGDGVNLETPHGDAVINYIRLSDPATSDSLIVSATLGTGIVIVGENLGGTREVWFNDKEASITPTWVTNNTIFVSVPSTAPSEVTNLLYLVDTNKDTLHYDFVVSIPEPEVYSAKNEWPQAGENLILTGDYFFEPVSIEFTGGVAGEIVSVTQSQVEVKVPDGATEGPITLSTNFGKVESTFHLWDKRNIVLNFDDKVANGWRIGLREDTDGPLDGKYLVVRGNIAKNQRDEGPGAPAESPYTMEFWGGPAGRTENFYPNYPNSYRDYVLKFEAKVKKWYGGYLNLCLATPTHNSSNQEIWSNSINARAVWAPWAATGEEFTTDDQWVTVVIPMSEFQYFMDAPRDVTYTPNQKFIEAAAGSFSTWMLGSPENSGNAVEFYIDNIRFVKP